jgi:hypothetical protein
MSSQFQVVEIGPQGGGQIPLLIQINGQGSMTGPGKTNGQVKSNCRFPATLSLAKISSA